MITTTPGIYSWYPSKGSWTWDGGFDGCGPWYTWCCELGYENLDVQQWADGEWCLIEFYNAPIIPGNTRWNYVLKDIRNVEITPGFLESYADKLNVQKRQAWADLDAKEKAQDEEKAKLDAHAEDTAERAKNIIMQTPSLVERIAENGLKEMDLDRIVKHIPRHQLNGLKGSL